jgi:LPXTG-motif cell wall-anchored protein
MNIFTHVKRYISSNRTMGAMLIACGVALSGIAVGQANATAITSPSPVDTSNAVRYSPDGSPIGDIVFEFISGDDVAKKIDAPFPLNFFGTRFPALCLSTNGMVIPIASTASNCAGPQRVNSVPYDNSLGNMSVDTESSMIAPLALDLNFNKKIHNPQRNTSDELQIASVSAASNVLTFTTTEPHGFLVGEYIKTSLNPNFLSDQASQSFYEGRIETVPSTTSFTVTSLNAFPDGTYTPIAGDRSVVFREIVFERITDLSLAGTTLTVTTENASDFGVGARFTFAGTGIAALDAAPLLVSSRVDATNFTVTVPASLTDVDASQAGDQTAISFATNRPWALERDNVGAIQQVYFGSTTIDGRDAYVVTWYRTATNDTSNTGINGGRFPAINPMTTSITAQLVIIKEATGSDANGWDFNLEFNIGHATDSSDGYLSTNPRTSCDANTPSACRWAMGVAHYSTGPTVTSISGDGTVMTFRTATPHGLVANQGVRAQGLNSSPVNLGGGTNLVRAIIDANTFTIGSGNTFSEIAAPAGATMGNSVSWELFPTSSVLELRDSAGATSLVRNSLNSSVLGRYTFAKVGGVVTNFLTPVMGAGITGTVPVVATPTTVASPTTVATPTTVASPVRTKTLPKTGMNTSMLFTASLMMAAGAALLALRTRNNPKTRRIQ